MLKPRSIDKNKVIATFYNKGRILGGKENPQDWCVEVYEARDFIGHLKEERPQAKPLWIEDSALATIRMYQGDRKIFELCEQEEVFEVIVQYSKQDLVRFDYVQVA